MAETLYKVLNTDGTCYYGGGGYWHLPKGKRPGKWMPLINHLEPCVRGYHLVTADQLIGWLGPAIWVVEGRGESVAVSDKTVYAQARLIRRIDNWNERTARLFACDCAEHALHLFETLYPDDKRPRHAIEVARLHADGKATNSDLAAAGAAAWAAAGDAARAAAGDAARAAAGDAARAAWDAARAAARAAAGHAARAAWDAARAAAWDAAWDAARAAGDAAGDAARAARAAARDAGDAERRWQVGKLQEILEA